MASLEEILLQERENQVWYQRLRRDNNLLIENKLAKRISSDEYAANRRIFSEELAECRRRRALLGEEIFGRRRPVRMAAVLA